MALDTHKNDKDKDNKAASYRDDKDDRKDGDKHEVGSHVGTATRLETIRLALEAHRGQGLSAAEIAREAAVIEAYLRTGNAPPVAAQQPAPAAQPVPTMQPPLT